MSDELAQHSEMLIDNSGGTVILHLSDIHFGQDSKEFDLKLRSIVLDKLLTLISTLEDEWRPSIICISGDIGMKGKSSDYTEAEEWIKKLLNALKLTPNELITCPGNHDLDQDQADRIPRIHNSHDADLVLVPPIAEHYENLFSEYIKFCRSLCMPPLEFGSTTSYLVGQRVIRGIRFLSCNSAWNSKKKREHDEDDGNLWLGLGYLQFLEGHKQLPNVKDEECKHIVVSMFHHPRECLSSEEITEYNGRQPTLYYIADKSHIILTGHTHGNPQPIRDQIEHAFHFIAGATFDKPRYPNSIRLIRVLSRRIEYKLFKWESNSWNQSGNVGKDLFPKYYDLILEQIDNSSLITPTLCKEQKVLNKQVSLPQKENDDQSIYKTESIDLSLKEEKDTVHRQDIKSVNDDIYSKDIQKKLGHDLSKDDNSIPVDLKKILMSILKRFETKGRDNV